ncbi:MAG TPA: NAD(P)H-hydrate dehydratase, partial [Gemmatimonadaceae bacterium]
RMSPRPLIRVVTSAEAAACDVAAIERGTPSRALMQRAGAASAAEIALRFGSRLTAGVLVLAGPGNNGGDAWVVAGALAASGVRVRVCEPVPAATDDARAERAIALPMVEAVPADSTALSTGDVYRGEGVVIDGLLGTGSNGPPRGAVAATLNGLRAMRDRAAIVALDLPSGIDASTGAANGAVRATLTLTYGTVKRGHLLARAVCGRIAVLDIGITGVTAAGALPQLVDRGWVARHVPEIAADAHKGSRRKIAIVGGGAGMSGAVILAAQAAWRSGVGMVKAIVARDSLGSVREAEPQSLTAEWPATDDAVARHIATWADAVVIGPGLGAGSPSRELVERVLRGWRGPVVMDADALNVFGSDVNALAGLLDGRAAILTPHAAEFARLTGHAVDDVLLHRFDVAVPLARHTRAVVLLKGQPTVVSAPNGERLVAASGTPLLAAAGSGDLLSGMVGTLLAQTGDTLSAAACAAWVHGRAAWLVHRRNRGVRGFSLSDVLEHLNPAWSVRSAPTRAP